MATEQTPAAQFRRSLEMIQTHIGLPQEASILYVGGGEDTTVADVFGKKQVIHLDSDIGAMAKVASMDYYAVACDLDSYDAWQPFYALAALSKPVLDSGIVNRTLKDSGYLIANTWHRSANEHVRENTLGVVGLCLGDEFLGPEPAREHLDAIAELRTSGGGIFVYRKLGRLSVDGFINH